MMRSTALVLAAAAAAVLATDEQITCAQSCAAAANATRAELQRFAQGQLKAELTAELKKNLTAELKKDLKAELMRELLVELRAGGAAGGGCVVNAAKASSIFLAPDPGKATVGIPGVPDVAGTLKAIERTAERQESDAARRDRALANLSAAVEGLGTRVVAAATGAKAAKEEAAAAKNESAALQHTVSTLVATKGTAADGATVLTSSNTIGTVTVDFTPGVNFAAAEARMSEVRFVVGTFTAKGTNVDSAAMSRVLRNLETLSDYFNMFNNQLTFAAGDAAAVVLASLRNVGTLRMHGNSDADGSPKSVSLPELHTVSGASVNFHDNARLASVSCPKLISVQEGLYLHNNPKLASVALQSLVSVRGDFRIATSSSGSSEGLLDSTAFAVSPAFEHLGGSFAVHGSAGSSTAAGTFTCTAANGLKAVVDLCTASASGPTSSPCQLDPKNVATCKTSSSNTIEADVTVDFTPGANFKAAETRMSEVRLVTGSLTAKGKDVDSAAMSRVLRNLVKVSSVFYMNSNQLTFAAGDAAAVVLASLRSVGTLQMSGNSDADGSPKSVSLPELRTVSGGGMHLFNNARLASVSCPKLISVQGDLYLYGSPKLASVALQSLVSVGRNFKIATSSSGSSEGLLDSTAFAVSPAFAHLGGIFEVHGSAGSSTAAGTFTCTAANGLKALVDLCTASASGPTSSPCQLDPKNVATCKGNTIGSVTVDFTPGVNFAAAEAQMSEVRFVVGSFTAQGTNVDSAAMSRVLRNLETVSDYINMENNRLTFAAGDAAAVVLASLRSVGTLRMDQNTDTDDSPKSVSLPELRTVPGGGMYLQDHARLASVSCPKLISVQGDLYLYGSPKLASVALQSLVSVGRNFQIATDRVGSNEGLLDSTAFAVSPAFEHLGGSFYVFGSAGSSTAAGTFTCTAANGLKAVVDLCTASASGPTSSPCQLDARNVATCKTSSSNTIEADVTVDFTPGDNFEAAETRMSEVRLVVGSFTATGRNVDSAAMSRVLRNLVKVSSDFSMNSNQLTFAAGDAAAVVLASLRSVKALYMRDNSDADGSPKSVSLPELRTVSAVSLKYNARLASVSCPKLISVQGDLGLHTNPKMASVALPSLVSVGGSFYISANDPAAKLLDSTAFAVSPAFEHLGGIFYVRGSAGSSTAAGTFTCTAANGLKAVVDLCTASASGPTSSPCQLPSYNVATCK